MTVHTAGFHHYHIRKRIYQKHEPYPHPEKVKKVFDRIIYATAIFGPVFNLPQLVKIWVHKNASGVSYISWFSFSIISAIWLVYGLLHKEKPIIFMNAILIGLQLFIAFGALLYG